MMKIGIVTFWGGHNYGSILQSYALSNYLQTTFNADVQILRITPPAMGPIKKSIFHYVTNPLRKYIISKKRQKSIRKGYDNINRHKGAYEKNLENFSQFEQSMPYTSLIKTEEELIEIGKNYDYLIAGSDQIWNPSTLKNCYFLTFAENKIKISYAASVGTDNPPFYCRNTFKHLLSQFNYISIREGATAKYFTKLLNKEVKQVLDPTFLLPQTLWDEMAQGGNGFLDNHLDFIDNQKYLLCYFLSDNPICYAEAEQYAAEHDLKIVSIVAGVSGGYDIKGAVIVPEAGPKEFLLLVKHATCVMTNSYHCTVFSLIFEKEFFCFSGISYSSLTEVDFRYVDLLRTLAIEDRFVGIDFKSKSVSIQPIDYKKLNTIIEEKRLNSQQYLQQALGNPR